MVKYNNIWKKKFRVIKKNKMNKKKINMITSKKKITKRIIIEIIRIIVINNHENNLNNIDIK